MNLVLITVLMLIVATLLGILSNIVASKIQPHIEHRTRLLVVLFGGLFGAAIVLTVASTYKPPTLDTLKVNSIKTIEDSRTKIREFGNQGVISAYWEVLLSNTGDINLSVTSYNVMQVGKDFPAGFYTCMNQGLYLLEDEKFKQLDLPIDIAAGSTRRVFVRLGLMMTPESFKLVRENFTDSSGATLKTIWRFLFSQGTDFYGNKIEPLEVDAVGFRLPSEDQVREQVFVISFKTSRGISVKEPLSWYKYGGAYDPRRCS